MKSSPSWLITPVGLIAWGHRQWSMRTKDLCLHVVEVKLRRDVWEHTQLDFFRVRPASFKTPPVLGGGRFSDVFKAAEVQSGQHPSPSVAEHHLWSDPARCIHCQQEQMQAGTVLQDTTLSFFSLSLFKYAVNMFYFSWLNTVKTRCLS